MIEMQSLPSNLDNISTKKQNVSIIPDCYFVLYFSTIKSTDELTCRACLEKRVSI